MAQRNDGRHMVAMFLQVHTASVLHALDTAPARVAAFLWVLLEVRIYSLLPEVLAVPVDALLSMTDAFLQLPVPLVWELDVDIQEYQSHEHWHVAHYLLMYVARGPPPQLGQDARHQYQWQLDAGLHAVMRHVSQRILTPSTAVDVLNLYLLIRRAPFGALLVLRTQFQPASDMLNVLFVSGYRGWYRRIGPADPAELLSLQCHIATLLRAPRPLALGALALLQAQARRLGQVWTCEVQFFRRHLEYHYGIVP